MYVALVLLARACCPGPRLALLLLLAHLEDTLPRDVGLARRQPPTPADPGDRGACRRPAGGRPAAADPRPAHRGAVRVDPRLAARLAGDRWRDSPLPTTG